MKYLCGLILTLMLGGVCAVACAQAGDIPPELLAIFEEQNGGAAATDYIEFTTHDGVRHAFILDGWGMNGYQCRNGAWQNVSSGSVLYGGAGGRFQRHGTQSPRADGSTYPDDLGFDVLGDAGGVCASYHYNGEFFALCGWVDADGYHGTVIIDGTTISYYPFGSKQAEYTVDTGDEMTLASWTYDYERHPASPDEAKRRAALLQSAMADDFPGYMLLNHEAFNSGTWADAGYYRIEDGRLAIKRVTYRSEYGCISEEDTMSIPLSENMLARLESEPAQNLISASGNGKTFLVDGAIDTEKIPLSGNMLESDAQPDGLILLMAEAGVRRLHWVTQQPDGAYAVITTQALPKDVSLDLFHAGSDELAFLWGNRSVSFARAADGKWRLSGVTSHSPEGSYFYEAVFCGVKENSEADGRNRIRIGSLSGAGLFETDLDSLPSTEAELRRTLDRSGWAVVDNPDPADRLHLRTAPKKDAASLGKFYNGTPVQVLANMGEWCHVRIGLDGHLEGYMMTRFLTFGEEMDDVACAYPDEGLREEYTFTPLYADAALAKQTHTAGDAYWIIGVVEDALYIVLTQSGETGYAPQSWFWAGNG